MFIAGGDRVFRVGLQLRVRAVLDLVIERRRVVMNVAQPLQKGDIEFGPLKFG
jgi:hypothetical protein